MTQTTSASAPLPQVALQLYTLRDELAKDLTTTLRQVAEVGFAGVETAFFGADSPVAQAAAELRALDLPVCAAHVPLPLGDARELVLQAAEQFRCSRIVWHGWPQDERYNSLAGLQRLADDYNEANAFAAANGLQLGLHNHWWEMTPVEGVLPYQFFLEKLDARIFFELDTYWATVAGRNAIDVVREVGARAPLLHIKDGPAIRHEPMTAVGSGTLDIPGIVNAGRGTAEWLIVELDECATDMLTAVRESYTYLTTHGLGVGKQ